MKFRASYSVLTTWNAGNWQRAIEMYFKLGDFITPAMLQGRNYHKTWEDHINKNKTLPVEFGSSKLNNPVAEGKLVVSLNDWLDLVGIIDCYDEPIIYDWKTGKTQVSNNLLEKQIGIYGLILKNKNKPATQGRIYHYDQYSKKSYLDIIYITDSLIEDTLNYVLTLSSEIHSYFIENDLYNKLGKKQYV